MIKLYPGFNPLILQTLPKLGIKGVVLEAFGAGNIPIFNRSLIPVIEELTKAGIIVIITTQCAYGKTEIGLYETGKRAFLAGATPGYTITSECALVKLMWLLSKQISREELQQRFWTNYAGEIHVE